MPHFATELFAHFVYSPELSYHDLLEREEELKLLVQATLVSNDAEFIHFEAMGDTLHAQCMLTAYGEDVFHSICEALAAQVPADVEGRLFFVSKELYHVHLYTFFNGKWQEACMQLPAAGPYGEGLRNS